MERDIDNVIKKFSMFLNSSWNIVIPLLENRLYTKNEDSINDWIQSNWEILVERKILNVDEYLEVYGDGADFYGISSRMTDIEALPTHYIIIVVEEGIDILNNEKIENKKYKFEKIVGFKNCFYIDEPPFNFVFIQDENKERVFSLDKVKFRLEIL